MLSETDLIEITPSMPTDSATTEHVQQGLPIPKASRVAIFSPDEWEAFVEEWATSLGDHYLKVRRLGGSGDLGVDIVGFCSKGGFTGVWDNYQCKQYNHPLMPSEIWVEIGKIIYYSYKGEYVAPRKHFFVGSKGIGTTLNLLLNNTVKLKEQTCENWEKYCQKKITTTGEISLEGELLEYFDEFDFKIFDSKTILELLEGHQKTGYHSVRFGGGLPQRPIHSPPPDEPTAHESRYIRQLLEAYGEHEGIPINSPADLKASPKLSNDYLRQRERFYHAEALRNFARDTVPEGTFDALQNEIFHGVVDVCESQYPDGFERMKATVSQASKISSTSNPLSPTTKIQDRQGICHQLANDDRLTWVQKHD